MSKLTHTIARAFRGQRLYLASVHSNSGMRWHRDQKQAITLSLDEALEVCEKASREWGTRCYVLDAKGNVAEPEGNHLVDALIGYDGVPYTVGDRVELSPSLDLWMRGAKFGTVHSVSFTPKDRVKVRSDHPQVKNLIAGPADYFRKMQS